MKGRGFSFRHIRKEDLEDYYYGQQDELMKRTSNPTLTINDAKKEVIGMLKEYKAKKPENESFVIEINGKFAGMISVDKISYSPWNKHVGTINYWMRKEYRGQGIMSKAIKLITKYAFRKYKFVRIQAYCKSINSASARVLQKAGYNLEGKLRKNIYKDGKYYDSLVFAKVK